MSFAVGQKGERMRVVDELARLKEQVYKLERKYCAKCQECDCVGNCCHEMVERCEDDE